jgi:hypothetical protein
MRPFSLEKCIHHLRLSLLGRQISIATDSSHIFRILSDVFANPHFAPKTKGSVHKFYCSIHCDPPWVVAMEDPSHIRVCRPSDANPMSFDIFRWTPDDIKYSGSFSYSEHHNSPSRDTTLELFATKFQRILMYEIIKRDPALRLVHAGALQYNSAGLMILAPTKGGKSTLTLAGVLNGMKFLSDDYALLYLNSGALLPFPKAMRFRKQSCEMFPDFGNWCAGITVDAGGETRYYIHPEQIVNNASGSGARLTHIVKLDGFSDKPVLTATSPGAIVGACVEADCFASGDQALDLIWQWADLLKNAKCSELKAGPPMETARVLLDFIREDQNGNR